MNLTITTVFISSYFTIKPYKYVKTCKKRELQDPPGLENKLHRKKYFWLDFQSNCRQNASQQHASTEFNPTAGNAQQNLIDLGTPRIDSLYLVVEGMIYHLMWVNPRGAIGLTEIDRIKAAEIYNERYHC